MFSAILTSIIFFLNILRYVSTAERFLCEEFYGGRNVVQKLNSISPNTPPHRLIILNASSYGWLDFDDAVDICRCCLNATLVVQDDVTQIRQYTPTWIGVRSRINETPTSTSGWEWVDGSGPLNRWQLNFASSINLLFPSGISYKGYAILAENDNQASDSSTQIKWSAYGTDETAGSRSNSHHY
uniref:C-type lectin domain-containing protein n=1 Tax=Romanomermis culicivorax TaxID=13658 RepID=A0A915JXB9_ROMCU